MLFKSVIDPRFTAWAATVASNDSVTVIERRNEKYLKPCDRCVKTYLPQLVPSPRGVFSTFLGFVKRISFQSSQCTLFIVHNIGILLLSTLSFPVASWGSNAETSGMTWSIPGKVILLGEYSVLSEGEAVCCALSPSRVLSDADTVIDPGLGLGFGSSSAAWIAAHSHEWINIEQAWNRFQKDYVDSVVPPSGADLITQLAGGLLRIKPPKYSRLDVSDEILSRMILLQPLPDQGRHVKENTFVNLASSAVDRFVHHVDFASARETMISATSAFIDAITIHKNSKDYIGAMQSFIAVAAGAGLETHQAKEIRESLGSLSGVAIVKGCGAGFHDVFLVVLQESVDPSKWLAMQRSQLAQKFKIIGSLKDRRADQGAYSTDSGSTVSVFAPVNIAWVKYMGKKDSQNNLPLNPSLSVTLKNLGSTTRVTPVRAIANKIADDITGDRADQTGQRLFWRNSSQWLDQKGKKRIETYWRRIQLEICRWLRDEGFDRAHIHDIEVNTENSVPESTGIATSASGFAAFTVAAAAEMSGDLEKFHARFTKDNEFRAKLARFSSLGSGSSIRSFFGPFVQWTADGDVAQLPCRLGDLVDCVVIFSNEKKSVSSSDAHRRVMTSAQISTRPQQALERFNWIKKYLEQGDFENARVQTAQEAFNMHELFETSIPPFSYLVPEARALAQKLASEPNGILTIDAGTNLHWFVRPADVERWRASLAKEKGVLRVMTDMSGNGIRFL